MSAAASAGMRPMHLLLGVLVMLVWGGNFTVIAMGLRHLDPFLLTALRFTFSAVPLVFFLPWPRQIPRWVVPVYGVIFGAGLWGVVNLAMHVGLSAGLASLVLQFSAFMTLVGSVWLLGERVPGAQWLGALVAAAGLLLLVMAGSGSRTLAGIGLVLLAALSWAACNLLVKRYRPPHMLAFVVWSSAFAAPVLFALTWAVKGAAPIAPLVAGLAGEAWFSILFQAYVTTVLGYFAWNSLLSRYPASTVAPLSLLVPVAGLLTAWWVSGEQLAPAQWLAIAVILAGLSLFVLGPRWPGPVILGLSRRLRGH